MWNDRYKGEDYAFGKEPNDFLRDTYLHIPRGGQVLCLAEGEGRNAVFLAQQGYKVHAVDMSEVGLEKARKLAEEREVSITTEVADLSDYDLGCDKWDGIVSIWAHMPENARKNLHAHIVTALKSSGVFILEAYTEQQLKTEAIGGPPESQKDRFMSLAKLRKELTDLDEIMGKETMREVKEGTRHIGLSAVVQFIAHK